MPGVEVVIANQVDTQASKALVDHVKGRYGAIDVLFVNAGVGKFATLDRADEVHFNSILNINVRGLYFMAKLAAPAIPNRGSIIFTGSTAGSKGGAGMSVYSATRRQCARWHELYPAKEALDAAIAGMEGGMPESFAQLDELLVTLSASVGRS